jgi:hypothetical protein
VLASPHSSTRTANPSLLPQANLSIKEYTAMGYMDKFTKPEDFRRDELIRIIEHSVENLTLQELEALYYDMTTKNFINE